MIFASLGSGSSGNCTFIGTDTSNILVDCGLSAKKTDTLLQSIGKSADTLSAIFLTHEHIDHIRGLKRLVSVYHIPVFGSEGTLSSLPAVLRDEYFRYAGKEYLHVIRPGAGTALPGMTVIPFLISHDAAEPFAYRIEAAEAPSLFSQDDLFSEQTGTDGCRTISVAVATDMGYYDNRICEMLKGLSAVLLEANHDRTMLANGPYPASLKRRIMSRSGHLSNNSCGELLAEIMNPSLRYVLLGHLSKENNTPQKAVETVTAELIRCVRDSALGFCDMEKDSFLRDLLPDISAAPPDRISKVIRLS